MLQDMSAAEYAGWQKYFSLEPWGFEMENARAGMICAAVQEPWRDKKVKDTPFTPWDFFPRSPQGDPPRKASDDEKASPKRVLQVLEAWGLAMGGVDRRQRRPRYD